MTHTDKLANIASEIDTLNADLHKVNAAIDALGAAILGATALAKANDLAKALANAKDRFATALADEQTEARDKRLSSFSDIRVTAEPAHNLISTNFVIEYKRLTWDMIAQASLPKDHKCNGFAALDDTAFEYLVSVKPSAIPPQIMALAPGNPQAAFEAYFVGKRRGVFQGTAAA